MQDLRDAYRALKSAPVVTAVAILSLALGIGANTAIFSILDSLLIRTLPVRAPQQLALVGDGTDRRSRGWTNPIWEQVRERPALFGGAFAWSSTRFNLAQGRADRARRWRVGQRRHVRGSRRTRRTRADLYPRR